MKISERPTEMLERQMLANRSAARYRSASGKRHFAHDPMFRAAFVREMVEMRNELNKRKHK